MSELTVKIRKKEEKPEALRREGILPAVLYGPKTESQLLEVDLKAFKDVYEEVGESTLMSLKVGEKTHQVLIHDTQIDSLSGEVLHVDFLQPSLKEKIEAPVSLVFEGEAEAVKSLGGTFIKYFDEIEVKALPQDLPHEIKVDIGKLKTFNDHIAISDLKVGEKVEILKNPEEIIASVLPPKKEEEELEAPVEEKIEEAEKVEKKKPEEEVLEEEK